MKVARLTIKIDGKKTTRNHHPGITQPWDLSLCGQDLMGDSIGGETWEPATEIEGKINCPDCLAIIKECRALKKSDFIDN